MQPQNGTLDAELTRYDAGDPSADATGVGRRQSGQPTRLETAAEAAVIDAKIAVAWGQHRRRFEVEPTVDVLSKATRALELVRSQLPACCDGANQVAA